MSNLNINDVVNYIKKVYGLNARVEYTDEPDSFEKIFGISLPNELEVDINDSYCYTSKTEPISS